jgi:hypothetical protein
MKNIYIAVLLTLLVGCNLQRKEKNYTPSFAGLSTQSKSVADGISRASLDSQEVKKLQREAMDLLDRLDYKAVKLLEQ